MLNIVELREMSSDKLEEMLEDARKEMFNLRFQKASASLENYARLRETRQEIAQLETVLHMRQMAIDMAGEVPEVAAALAGQQWSATARYVYEEGAWQVEFVDEDGDDLASVMLNLNKKRTKGRKARQTQKKQPHLITRVEIAG